MPGRLRQCISVPTWGRGEGEAGVGPAASSAHAMGEPPAQSTPVPLEPPRRAPSKEAPQALEPATSALRARPGQGGRFGAVSSGLLFVKKLWMERRERGGPRRRRLK
jgi:hypothetical protein